MVEQHWKRPAEEALRHYRTLDIEGTLRRHGAVGPSPDGDPRGQVFRTPDIDYRTKCALHQGRIWLAHNAPDQVERDALGFTDDMLAESRAWLKTHEPNCLLPD